MHQALMQHHASMRNQPNLPEEVIQEILTRLPVKSLLRFRSVSKSWLSLISTSHFANLHFQRSSQRIFLKRITLDLTIQSRSIDVNASLHDESAFLDVDFFPVRFQIKGSCRGLLLVEFERDDKLMLWNPSTRDWIQIPPNPWKPNTFLYGFGYDAATDDYLILLILLCPRDCDQSACYNRLEIFSFRANSWKELQHDYPYMNPIDDEYYNGDGCILNGAIHWLSWRLGDEIILAFDLTQRKFREVPLPDDFDYQLCELKVVGDLLALIVKDIDDNDEMWVMREYGVKSSWTKYIKVEFFNCYPYFNLPVCFTKDGSVVLLCGTDLMKFNDKGELLERSPQDLQVFDGYATVYNETLLYLPGDDGETKEEDSE